MRPPENALEFAQTSQITNYEARHMNTEFVDRHLPPERPAGRQVLHRRSGRRVLRPARVGALNEIAMVTQ